MAHTLDPLRILTRALCVVFASAMAWGAGSGALAAAEPRVELVMVEQPGCAYCIAWHQEIGPAYPRTEAGAFAPLRQEQLLAIPDDLTLERRVVFTPTFVLVDGAGRELGRIEGYPGDDFFWPLLERMLAEKAGFARPADTTGTPRED